MNILECLYRFVHRKVIAIIYLALVLVMSWLLWAHDKQAGFPDWAYYMAGIIIMAEFICYYLRLRYDRSKLKCCSINKDVEASDVTHGVVILFISGPLLVAMLTVLILAPAMFLVSLLDMLL